jgi:AcrR family transcriptional regulator
MESQLLDTATRLFARKGQGSTTLEDIAGEMGISRPTLYHYVSSKARLLEMLVEQVTRSMADVLEHLAAGEDLSGGQKLTSMVALMVRQRAEHPVSPAIGGHGGVADDDRLARRVRTRCLWPPGCWAAASSAPGSPAACHPGCCAGWWR